MTPEQRATALCERLGDRGLYEHRDQIARAIRAGENEALDGAGNVIRDRWAAFMLGACARPTSSTYEALVRALKTRAPRKTTNTRGGRA